MISGLTTALLDVSDVEHWLASLHDPELDDSGRVDRIGLLEELKNRASAAQVRLTADLARSQRGQAARAGIDPARQGRGIGSQVGMARRESPHRGGQLVGLSVVLVEEMPHTLVGVETGRLSEHRAQILVRETACLSLEDRRRIDEELCADLDRIEGWGSRRLAGEARRLAARLDAASVAKRVRKAESERSVSIRPAPDTMTYLTGLLPVAQGVACHAALSRRADELRATGDPRSRGQIMADTLVERVTGQATASAVPIAVNLTVSDTTLHAGGHEPAWLAGYGHLPAATARDLVATALDEAMATLRRLYVAPSTGRLTQMDSVARIYPQNLGLFIDLRDQTCRTPYCDAPIRHHDHVGGWANGAATTADEGQGLCEQCDYAKQAPGWQVEASVDADGVHQVDTTTPTGHRHRSRAPALPRPAPVLELYQPEVVLELAYLDAS